MKPPLNRRPIVVMVAGPNGAGKTTFYHTHLKAAALRFLNTDVLAKDLAIDAYRAAEIAGQLRDQLLAQKESFVFETVFSDPVGDKVNFLQRAATRGYTVVLFFIGIDSPELSKKRVKLRVSQGGHSVPTEKLITRYPRTMANLRRAIGALPFVYVYDHSDLAHPYQLVAEYRDGKLTKAVKQIPAWLEKNLPVLPADGDKD
ncbi:MAG: zeta toxin family protein [Chthoniobacteraceae bacterium]